MKPLVRLARSEDLARLRELWDALYEHQTAHGMRIRLPQNAFAAWVSSIEPVLDRFAVVTVAELEGELMGFVAGRTRMLPAFFGSGHVGFIGEVFVVATMRSQGIGEALLRRALEWFEERGILRIELQVVSDNPDALRFYERLGWKRELVQLTYESRRF
jgi:GNAT superfamily N-acetyltransferase